MRLLWALLVVVAANLRKGRGILHYYPAFPGGVDFPHLIALVDPTKPEAQPVRAAMQACARKHTSDDVLYIEVGTDQEDALKFFSLEMQDVPFVFLVQWDTGIGHHPFSKFRFDGLTTWGEVEAANNTKKDITAKALSQFTDDYLAGKLRPWVVSEPPLQEQGGFAFQMVGSQWDSHVMEPRTDVLVFFFAPWCGYSKRLQPKYDALARRYARTASVSIVKIDASKNDVTHPKVNIEGYPTVLLFPRDKKMDPVSFDHTPEDSCREESPPPKWCSEDPDETFIGYATHFFQKHASTSDFNVPVEDPVDELDLDHSNEF